MADDVVMEVYCVCVCVGGGGGGGGEDMKDRTVSHDFCEPFA